MDFRIIAGKPSHVFESDPSKFKGKQADAPKPFNELTWSAYRKLIPHKWTPGMGAPVDPVAAALGAREGQVLTLFLGEAMLLSALGGLAGLALGIGIAQALHWLFPAMPVHTPWLFALVAELSAVSIGLAAGVMPARRAARLDPVEALHEE